MTSCSIHFVLFSYFLIFNLFQIVSCDLPEQLASIPLIFDDPVYGSNQLTFTDFMAPGKHNFMNVFIVLKMVEKNSIVGTTFSNWKNVLLTI